MPKQCLYVEDGQRCTRTAIEFSNYCLIHQPDKLPVKDPKKKGGGLRFRRRGGGKKG